MKNGFLKTGILALLITLSSVAFGNAEGTANDKDSTATTATTTSATLEVKIYPRDKGSVAVNFRKQLNETVKVIIYDNSGKQIFDEKISKDELVMRRYDLSNLPDGNYYVEVSNGNYLVKQLVKKVN